MSADELPLPSREGVRGRTARADAGGNGQPHAPHPAISARAQGFLFLLFTACCWGFNWPVAKFLLSELPPFSMRTVCSILGVIFAFALAATRRERLWPPAGQWRNLLVFAFLNYGAFSVLTTLSLVWLRASEAVVVTYTLPIWAGLIAWPMLGERPTVTRVAAMALGLAGVGLLVGIEQFRASWTTLPGVLCGFTAAALFGLGTVIAKRQPLAMPPVAGVAWQAMLGSVPVATLALWESPNWANVTPLGTAAIFYVGVIPMVVAYLAWFRALRLLPASTAATAVLLAPMVGVFTSALLLGDPLGPRQLIALAVTLSGIALAARS